MGGFGIELELILESINQLNLILLDNIELMLIPI